MKKYNRYSKELKLKAVKLYLSSDISAENIAKTLGIKSDTQIHSWIKKYNQLGEKAFEKKSSKIKKAPSLKEKKEINLKKENELLKIENEYLKKVIYPSTRRDKYLVIDELKDKYSVTYLCKVAEVARSSYYKWKKSQEYPSKRKLENEILEIVIKNIYNNYGGTYGVKRMCLCVNREVPFRVNHKRVYRIMKDLGVKSIIRNQNYKGKSWAERISANVLNREFSAEKPLEKLCMDITQINIEDKKIYLNAIKDIFNNQIIAYDIAEEDGFPLVKKTLLKLFKMPLAENCILHTDQGFQYTERKYCDMLKRRGIVQSMSRRGNCWDNVPIEIFLDI